MQDYTNSKHLECDHPLALKLVLLATPAPAGNTMLALEDDGNEDNMEATINPTTTTQDAIILLN